MDKITHEHSMMDEQFLLDIMSGRKKYEGRVNTDKYRSDGYSNYADPSGLYFVL
jgi:hypothetical protein